LFCCERKNQNKIVVCFDLQHILEHENKICLLQIDVSRLVKDLFDLLSFSKNRFCGEKKNRDKITTCFDLKKGFEV